MFALNESSLADFHNAPISLLQEKCPLLFGTSNLCNITYMSSLLPGDEATVLDTVRYIADHYHNTSGDSDLLQRWAMNRSVGDVAFYTLIVLYAHLICFGALGNGLVVLAVMRKASMQTARNMFIVNLAVSDLLLCLITMPLTLLEILTRYWPLGENTLFLCKLFGGLQGVSVFVSAMSITAIALDRYQAIVYPTRKGLRLVEVCIILACVWALAILLASPMFIVRKMDHHQMNEPMDGLPSSFDYCVESWAVERGRAYYSIFSMMCQYVVPIITVSIAHMRITRKLRFRMSSLSSRTSSLREVREQRARRTNTLLAAIALIYAVSWIPLNVCNLVSDFTRVKGSKALERMRIVYAVCHMMGMSSACSNPILYGWLNENFRKEFVEIFHCVTPCLARARRRAEQEEDRRERTHCPLVAGSLTNGRTQLMSVPCEETQLSRDIPMQQLTEPNEENVEQQ